MIYMMYYLKSVWIVSVWIQTQLILQVQLTGNVSVQLINCNFQITVQTDGSYDEQTLKKIRADRGYSYEDMMEISRETLPNYDEKVNWEIKLHNYWDCHLSAGVLKR